MTTITRDHIRNPAEWGVDQLSAANQAVGRAGHALRRPAESREAPLPAVRRIGLADLQDVLARGLADFAACRSDVLFLCIVYPLAGLVLAWVAFGYEMLPLIFPLASGFALIGPVAAIGLYEMSRQREHGVGVSWADAFGVVRAPAFGAILVLGLVLLAIFLLWLAAAQAIYLVTLGPEPPASLGAFVRDVFTTGAGWAMIVVGHRGRLPVRGAGADDQRGVVPAAARPRRRALHRGRDLGLRGAGEPRPDGGLGADRRRRPGARLAAGAARADLRDAGARARDLASLPQGRAALSPTRPAAAVAYAPAGQRVSPVRPLSRLPHRAPMVAGLEPAPAAIAAPADRGSAHDRWDARSPNVMQRFRT